VHRLAAEALGLLAAEIAAGSPSGTYSDRVLPHEIVERQSTSPVGSDDPA